MELPKDLKDKVWNYCRLNDITDVNGFIIKTIKKGLDVEVYGLLGKTLNEDEKDLKTDSEGEKDLRDSRKPGGIQENRVEIEVIREIRVEVPVEVIKEVEKVVTKIEYISDKNLENELLLKIQQLENRPPEIVEVVKEVPVDRVVEKIIYTTDDIQINELGGKIAKLENERQLFSTKTTEMENIFHNKMSKKDEELDELRRTLDEHLSKPPVEKIVELVVEKEITDNSLKSKLDALQNTLTKVRQETLEKDKKIKELELTIQEIQKFQENKQAVYLKGSNLDDKLYK